MKSLFHSKKGFELSVNLIVTLIIAIVLFGFGLAFATNLFSGGDDLTNQVFANFDERVQDLACSGTITYCLAEKSVKIDRGELDIVGLAVKNQLGYDTEFKVTASDITLRIDGEVKQTNVPLNLFDLQTGGRIETIANRDKHTFGIGVAVPKTAESGQYTITLDLMYNEEVDPNVGPSGVFNSYTDGKKIKFFVEVK